MGTPNVEISVILSPAAVQTVTVQFGPQLNGWVATNAVLVNWPVYVNLVPVPVFDPFDAVLLRQMLTYEGQLDPFIAQRFALARLQQFRRRAELDRLGLFSLSGITNLVNDAAQQGTYINMATLPDQGMLGLNIRLPAGIAVADVNQVRAGIIPSYKNGLAVSYTLDKGSGGGGSSGSPSGVTAMFAKSSGADGVELFAKVPVAQSQPKASGTVTISDVGEPTPLQVWQSNEHNKERKYGDVNVTYTVAWSAQAPGAEYVAADCSGGGTFQGSSGTKSGTAKLFAARGESVTLKCTLTAKFPGEKNYIFDFAADVRQIPIGTPEERKKANEEASATRKENEAENENRKKAVDSLGPVGPEVLPGLTGSTPWPIPLRPIRLRPIPLRLWLTTTRLRSSTATHRR